MRLRRLDLTRFGKFTEKSIDFGEAVEGQPDLHIIYGPNEAGKSTALAGFLDFLFGIEKQSRYGFLHNYSTMCVGGRLELIGGPRDLVRRKRPTPTLLDNAGNPAQESLIQSDLAGIDRNAYRTMFLLDDDTIEQGGKSILASNGDLGQLLFSASAGLSELSNRLTELKTAADGFAKPGARTGQLQELKSSLTALKQEREQIDTLASEFSRLKTACTDANEKYQEALGEHQRANQELAHLRRLLSGLPHRTAHRLMLDQLSVLSSLPDPPPGWSEQLPVLQTRHVELRTQIEIATANIERIARKMEGIVVDDVSLSLRGRLTIFEQLRSRYIAAEPDLPNIRNEHSQKTAEILNILRQIGQENEQEPANLLLTVPQATNLKRLVATRPAIDAAVDAADRERSKAIQALTAAQRALGAHPDRGATPSAPILLPVIAEVRHSDHAPSIRAAESRKRQANATIETQIRALAPWTGSPDDLERLEVPDADKVKELGDAKEKYDILAERLLDEISGLERKIAITSAALNVVRTSTGLVGDQDAQTSREARNVAWTAHRAILDTATAQVFEQTMHRDDDITNLRFGHAQEVAEIKQKSKELATLNSELRHVQDSLGQATAKIQERQAEFIQIINAVSPAMVRDMTPSGFLTWITRYHQARDTWAAIKAADLEVRDALEHMEGLRQRLALALERSGVAVDLTADLDALMIAAETATEHEKDTERLRQAVGAAEREVETRELAVMQSARTAKLWREEWLAACAACWLGEGAAELPVDVVNELLSTAALLVPALAARASLADRITGMESDQAAFIAQVEDLAAALGLDTSSAPVLDSAQAILDKVSLAIAAAGDLHSLQQELAQAEAVKDETENLYKAHVETTTEMMEHMQAGSFIELAIKLEQAKQKSDLKNRIVQAEASILSALHVKDMSEAEVILDGVSAPGLEAEQASLTSQVDTLHTRMFDLHQAYVRAKDQLDAVVGDDAVAKIEEKRRTLILTIQDQAERYVRLRVGVAAAERALRIYRDQHRSSMMENASTAFSTITEGAYRKLTTQPEDNSEVLVAVGADGFTKLATELSKGTRFQLYLALRAAGYHEFASARTPVPFIADDIMETFDNPRSRETFRIFEGMARCGQVIYMTHHDHLREIAEATVPGVKIHTL